MFRVLLLSAALAIGPQVAVAAPAAPLGVTVDSGSAVTKVHGRHRRCRWGRVHRWHRRARHRHIRRHRVVRCRRWYGRGAPPHRRRRGCWKIGPIWFCP